MKCPYCHNEMQKGSLYNTGVSYGWVFWLQKEYYMQHTFLPSTKQKVRDAGGIICEPEQDIYVCKDCGKMIADIK